MKGLAWLIVATLCLAAVGAPQRVLSTSTLASAIMVGLGAADRLAAIDSYGGIVPGTEGAVVAGRGSAISREALLELGVDYAFIWHYQTDLAGVLDALGIPYGAVAEPSLAGYGDEVLRIGAALELEREAREYAADFAAGVERLRREAGELEPVRVYLELYSPFRTVGGASYIGELLALAGMENLAAAMPRSGLIGREAVVLAEPEWIICVDGFGDPEEIAGRAGFAALPAVVAGRIRTIDRLHLVAGADLGAAVRALLELRN